MSYIYYIFLLLLLFFNSSVVFAEDVKDTSKSTSAYEKLQEEKNNKTAQDISGFYISAFASFVSQNNFGFGFDLSYRMKLGSSNEILGIRALYSSTSDDSVIDESYLKTFKGPDITDKSKAQSYGVVLDYMPSIFQTEFANIYLSAGYYFGNQEKTIQVSGNGNPLFGDIIITDSTYWQIPGMYDVKTEAKRNLTGPYLGLGIEKKFEHIGVFANFGLIFVKDYNISHNIYAAEASESGLLVFTDDYNRSVKRYLEDNELSNLAMQLNFGIFYKF